MCTAGDLLEEGGVKDIHTVHLQCEDTVCLCIVVQTEHGVYLLILLIDALDDLAT